jgi:hypothetical protein
MTATIPAHTKQMGNDLAAVLGGPEATTPTPRGA